MVYISQNELNNCIKNNLYKIPNDIDLIVANPRSGIIPATIIALLKNLPICDISIFHNNHIYEYGSTKNNNFINNIDDSKRILIVEDSSYSGDSVNKIRNEIPDKYKDKCTILTIYVNERTKNLSDIYFEEINSNRIFEWNLFHHKYLNYSALELNVIFNKELIIKPTQLIDSIIIDDNLKKEDVSELLKLLNYNRIIYKKEIKDEAIIICKNKKDYESINKFIIEF